MCTCLLSQDDFHSVSEHQLVGFVAVVVDHLVLQKTNYCCFYATSSEFSSYFALLQPKPKLFQFFVVVFPPIQDKEFENLKVVEIRKQQSQKNRNIKETGSTETLQTKHK